MALFVGFIFFGISFMRGRIKINTQAFESGLWMIPYLLGLVMISYLGSFGGRNIIPFGWDFVVIAIFTMGILYMAVRGRVALTREEMNHFLGSESLNTV